MKDMYKGTVHQFKSGHTRCLLVVGGGHVLFDFVIFGRIRRAESKEKEKQDLQGYKNGGNSARRRRQRGRGVPVLDRQESRSFCRRHLLLVVSQGDNELVNRNSWYRRRNGRIDLRSMRNIMDGVSFSGENSLILDSICESPLFLP